MLGSRLYFATRLRAEIFATCGEDADWVWGSAVGLTGGLDRLKGRIADDIGRMRTKLRYIPDTACSAEACEDLAWWAKGEASPSIGGQVRYQLWRRFLTWAETEGLRVRLFPLPPAVASRLGYRFSLRVFRGH